MGGEIEFKAYAPAQGQLLPSYTAEALDPSDPAFFVDEVVEGLELRAFERRCSALGERAYPTRMLLKLWLFAAISGVYSGREIARRLHYGLRFRYPAWELRPDFRTINRFRMVHVRDFREVFPPRFRRPSPSLEILPVPRPLAGDRPATKRHSDPVDPARAHLGSAS